MTTDQPDQPDHDEILADLIARCPEHGKRTDAWAECRCAAARRAAAVVSKAHPVHEPTAAPVEAEREAERRDRYATAIWDVIPGHYTFSPGELRAADAAVAVADAEHEQNIAAWRALTEDNHRLRAELDEMGASLRRAAGKLADAQARTEQPSAAPQAAEHEQRPCGQTLLGHSAHRYMLGRHVYQCPGGPEHARAPLGKADRGPWGKTVGADIAELRRMADEGPLSPYYEHPECGFHWRGRDGMDIPLRDGQPVCPRCELAKAEKQLAALQRRRDERHRQRLHGGMGPRAATER